MSYYISPDPLLIGEKNIEWSIYMNVTKDKWIQPKAYRPKVPHIELPFKKYDSAQSVLEACNGNRAQCALRLAKMSEELKRDEKEMLAIVNKIPDAIAHADKSILTTDFLEKTLTLHPHVYNLLPDDIKQRKDAVDAYAVGMQTNGCDYKTESHFDLTCSRSGVCFFLPLYEYALSKDCPLDLFYSAENYQKAYEQIILQGSSESGVLEPCQNPTLTASFNPATAYIHMARIEFRGDEQRMSEYQWAEAHAIANCIEHIASEVSHSGPKWENGTISAVERAIKTLKNPPAILGVEPREDLATEIENRIVDAERRYRNNCEQWVEGLSPHTIDFGSDIDRWSR